MKRLLWLPATLLMIGLGLLLYSTRSQWQNSGALAPRTAPDVTFPRENPFAGKWAAVELFPGVPFDNPVAIVQERSAAGTYFIAEKNGRLLGITPAPAAKSVVALDISARVVNQGEAGMVGLALHPAFGKPLADGSRFIYLFYVARVESRMYDRLSRFQVGDDGVTLEPDSERVLIDQLDEDTDHNSGNLTFGPDGFLYVGVGDEGGIGDQFGNAQHIDKDLFSGILRIDVDCLTSVSHPIRRQPQTGHSQGYCIPNDNPFVDRPDALEEFWAIGFRNPHRFAFDETGLWGADVGQDLREEVFLATKGSNHQWSYREGTIPFAASPLRGQRPDPLIGIETTPVYDYAHTNGNGAAIGGVVYRGRQFPELTAKYIFGDYNSGLIWALQTQALTGVAGVPKLETLMRLPPDRRIASFGTDRRGELLMATYGKRSTILALERRDN